MEVMSSPACTKRFGEGREFRVRSFCLKYSHFSELSAPILSGRTNTDVLNVMLKRVQHDKKKYVIPNLFRNLEFSDDNKLIEFVLNTTNYED